MEFARVVRECERSMRQIDGFSSVERAHAFLHARNFQSRDSERMLTKMLACLMGEQYSDRQTATCQTAFEGDLAQKGRIIQTG